MDDAQAAEIGKEIIEFYRSLMNNQTVDIGFRLEAAGQLEDLVFDFDDVEDGT